ATNLKYIEIFEIGVDPLSEAAIVKTEAAAGTREPRTCSINVDGQSLPAGKEMHRCRVDLLDNPYPPTLHLRAINDSLLIRDFAFVVGERCARWYECRATRSGLTTALQGEHIIVLSPFCPEDSRTGGKPCPFNAGLDEPSFVFVSRAIADTGRRPKVQRSELSSFIIFLFPVNVEQQARRYVHHGPANLPDIRIFPEPLEGCSTSTKDRHFGTGTDSNTAFVGHICIAGSSDNLDAVPVSLILHRSIPHVIEAIRRGCAKAAPGRRVVTNNVLRVSVAVCADPKTGAKATQKCAPGKFAC